MQRMRWPEVGGAVAHAFPEIVLAHELGYYGDHAGHWETSIMMAMRPERVVELAVRRMLPKNRLGRAMLKKLKLYATPTHPHQAQSPKPLDL